MAHDRKQEASASSKPNAHPHPGTGPAFQHFQAAMVMLQQGKFENALVAFDKLLATAPPELLERCKMYSSICQRQMDKHTLTFSTPEEHYDYAVSMLNTGYYEEAREEFGSILAAHPEADYALYGLALLDAMTGHTQDCLGNLAKAIELNPKNRLQARVDNDFQSMADDPRFTELLYPEVP